MNDNLVAIDEYTLWERMLGTIDNRYSLLGSLKSFAIIPESTLLEFDDVEKVEKTCFVRNAPGGEKEFIHFKTRLTAPYDYDLISLSITKYNPEHSDFEKTVAEYQRVSRPEQFHVVLEGNVYYHTMLLSKVEEYFRQLYDLGFKMVSMGGREVGIREYFFFQEDILVSFKLNKAGIQHYVETCIFNRLEE